MSQNLKITIDFTRGELLSVYRRHGWSVPEPHGSWTDGNEAGIEMVGLDRQNDYLCEMYVTPFLALPEVQEQRLVIKLAGTEVYHEAISTGGTVRFTLPAVAIDSDGGTELAFWFPNAIAPSSLLLNEDSRKLGFSFSYITFTQIVDDAASRTIDVAGEAPLPVASTPSPRLTIITRPSGKKKIAAVTMVYNEPEYIPIWLKHYSRHVGLENCFIIDHGSDDGSTERLSGCNVIRIPRSPYDPHLQSTFNSKFCSSLLCWYEWVLYSDVDEILIPDPDVSRTLTEYCDLSLPAVVTAIGLNIQHVPTLEEPVDLARPVTAQRSWMFPSSSMCKPLLISRDVRWPGGSHSADAALTFHHLYAFHLRWFDLDSSVRRLAKTRTMAWAALNRGGAHARLEDEAWLKQFSAFSALPRDEAEIFEPGSDPLKKFLDSVVASQRGREFDKYKIDLTIWGNRLWRIPQRFVGTF